MERTNSWCLSGGAVLSLSLFLAGSLVIVPEAYAAPRVAPTETEAQKRARARGIFKRAEIQYALGKFATALTLYDQAYQVLPLPGFLFNIGQCHRHLRNYERALFFYRGYLRKSTRPADLAVARKLIKLTERLWTEQKARARARVVPRRRVVRPRLRPRRGAATGPFSGDPGGLTDRTPGVHKRWWFWTALAAGLAAVVGVSVGVGMAARRDAQVPGGTIGTIHVDY